MDDVVTIDGSMGEGGGQVLRTSLSLSAITGREVEIAKIRAGRAKPGLKRQHLTCVKAVAEICGAKVSDVDVGTMKLSFAPGPIKGGDYRFDVGTAGSATLVAQTVIPVLLKADKSSTVTITGGTHVPFAPIWEFFAETCLPELRLMGARIEAELVQPGFYPAADGVVKIRVWPFERPEHPSYALTELGEVREVESFGPGNYCYAQLDYARCSIVFSAVGTHDKSRKWVAGETVRQVRDFLKAGKACEKHLADQLLAPCEVFVGGRRDLCEDCDYENWDIGIQRETEHYVTNRAVIQAFAMREDW